MLMFFILLIKEFLKVFVPVSVFLSFFSFQITNFGVNIDFVVNVSRFLLKVFQTFFEHSLDDLWWKERTQGMLKDVPYCSEFCL